MFSKFKSKPHLSAKKSLSNKQVFMFFTAFMVRSPGSQEGICGLWLILTFIIITVQTKHSSNTSSKKRSPISSGLWTHLRAPVTQHLCTKWIFFNTKVFLQQQLSSVLLTQCWVSIFRSLTTLCFSISYIKTFSSFKRCLFSFFVMFIFCKYLQIFLTINYYYSLGFQLVFGFN